MCISSKRYRAYSRLSFPFLSLIFVIPKYSAVLCVFLNLKKIFVFIPVQHFRMTSLFVILLALRPYVWAVSLVS